ncbi:hypothetical protein LEM8419_01762 [Neolewinella maritima]|uniref:Lipoprotein n=1 Tax=Neolewinella maritima TaxID=1383882 RepID=A0ABN8F8L0_9BACT|nr:hypothetical protein [Neolewinella maritima]CAH1000628.1 hypothetical protein LEM8419_01762 [Neolewinella maritima]
MDAILLRLLLTATFLLLVASCASVNTGGDTEAPILEVRALHGPGDTKLYRSSRPGVDIEGLGCPDGKFSGAYITDLSAGYMDLSVTSIDPGGTRALNLEITPVRVADVVDIECVTCFGEDPGIEVSQTAPLEVTVTTDLASITPRNLHTLTFRVTGLDTVLTINAEAIDLNGNRVIFVENPSGFYAADILDDGVCSIVP